MFNLKDFHYYIPLAEYSIEPYILGSYPLEDMDASVCKFAGIARFGGDATEHSVFRYTKLIHFWNSQTKQNDSTAKDIDFILLPKKHVIPLELEITGPSSTYLSCHSVINLDYAPPVKMWHSLRLKDFYEYIAAGGNINRKIVAANFKFAGIVRSNTRFVSL